MKRKSFTLCISALAVLSLAGCAVAKHHDAEGFTSVFNGKNLKGWIYDPVYWRVEDGAMVGEITPSTIVRRNTFIYKKGLILRDFELKVDFRVSEDGNSGVSYRNSLVDELSYALKGYQADIDGRNHYTGQNYEERGRQFLALRGQSVVIRPDHISLDGSAQAAFMRNDTLSRVIRPGDWNEYHIIAEGNHLLHYINGTLMSEVRDEDPTARSMEGLLGVQVHVGPPMTVEYKNFRVKKLN